MDGLRRLRERLEGPPPALPQLVDDLAERWWSLPPRARLLLAGLATLGTVVVLGAVTSTSPWGGRVSVPVATRDLAPGQVVGSGDVHERDWPEALAPGRVAVVGRRLGTGVPAGSPVTGAHLAEPGPAAGLPPDRVAVPLPVDALPVTTAELGPGQRLDLFAAEPHGAGRPLTRAATILVVHETHLWVAVPRDQAAGVATALGHGALGVALLPAGPGRPSPD